MDIAPYIMTSSDLIRLATYDYRKKLLLVVETIASFALSAALLSVFWLATDFRPLLWLPPDGVRALYLVAGVFAGVYCLVGLAQLLTKPVQLDNDQILRYIYRNVESTQPLSVKVEPM